MNRVGKDGCGESVWLAWFLITTLRSVVVHSDARYDAEMATAFRALADTYAAAVETHGWDGEWHRRVFCDDGTPIGSASQAECKLDVIAQKR